MKKHYVCKRCDIENPCILKVDLEKDIIHPLECPFGGRAARWIDKSKETKENIDYKSINNEKQE